MILLFLLLLIPFINASDLASISSIDQSIGNGNLLLTNVLHHTSYLSGVQPIDDAHLMKTNHFRSALLEKLKEVFYFQYPTNRKFSLRTYKAVNWPPGVESYLPPKWRMQDMLKINEGIPFYHFILRDEDEKANLTRKCIYFSSKDLEILNSARTNKNMRKKVVYRALLKRFREETGQIQAEKIDWHRLDKSLLPDKYKNIRLNNTTLSMAFVYQNPEIIDNIHFYDKVPTTGTEQGDNVDYDELIEILNSDDESKSTESGTVIQSSRSEDVSAMECEDIGVPFDIYDFDHEAFNENILLVNESDGQSPRSTDSKKCRHLKPVEIMEKALKADLKSLFYAQHPNEKYSLRQFDIVNWPEGIDLLSKTWRKREMETIREMMQEFVFKKRELAIIDNSDYKREHVRRKTEVHDFLLKRYREESGDTMAININWNQLDRRNIPSKYDEFDVNCYTQSHKAFYGNPEIVYNVHFYPLNDPEEAIIRKRKYTERNRTH